MDKLTTKLGGWVYRYHLWQGRIIYALILSHTMALVLFHFVARGVFDPFYVYIDICVLCKYQSELFYSLGRIAFWLISFAILASTFRTRGLLRKYWRVFHWFNYFAFGFVAYHAYRVGTDAQTQPFYSLFLVLVLFVGMTILLKFYKVMIIFFKSGK